MQLPTPSLGVAPTLSLWIATPWRLKRCLIPPLDPLVERAGVQTSQLLVSKGVEAVIASSVGPNASAVLQAADIAVYHCGSDVDTIRDAVLALRDERLELMSGPNVASHTGTRQRFGTGKARARNDEVASLTQEASELQQRLEEISNRLKDLEGTDD